jgi:hypothetical protein
MNNMEHPLQSSVISVDDALPKERIRVLAFDKYMELIGDCFYGFGGYQYFCPGEQMRVKVCSPNTQCWRYTNTEEPTALTTKNLPALTLDERDSGRTVQYWIPLNIFDGLKVDKQ